MRYSISLMMVVVMALVLSVFAFALDDKELLKEAKQIFEPIKEYKMPKDAVSMAKIELGKMLYYEPRLSRSGDISCNSCHNLAGYGVDNLPNSLGHNFQQGGRNAPTVLNSKFNIAQFWDGRAKDLTEQAKGPVLNPKEMAMPNSDLVIERLKSIPEYVSLFKKAFPGDKDAVNYNNMAMAIAAFEETLVTPSKFDKFLEGDLNAMSTAEKAGLSRFMKTGCIDCHTGIGVGGNSYRKFGMINPYQFQSDKGVYELTKDDADMYVFKVASLRNIERTYPYFHDGKVWSLHDAVKTMGHTQLGIELTDAQISEIITFLKSLTGEVPDYAKMLPTLPPSTDTTPKPYL